MINVASRQCLTATADGRVEQRRCDRSDAVRWRFRPASLTGLFEIVHHRNNRCLSTAGAAVRLAVCTDRPAGRWQLVDSHGPTAQLRNEATGRCLTVAGRTAVPHSCDDQRARRWTVRVIAAPFLTP